MTDSDPRDNLGILGLKDERWLRLPYQMPLSWRELVYLNRAVFPHEYAAWCLFVLQLCNFDVGDWCFRLFSAAIELPKNDSFIRSKFHRSNIAILEAVDNYERFFVVVTCAFFLPHLLHCRDASWSCVEDRLVLEPAIICDDFNARVVAGENDNCGFPRSPMMHNHGVNFVVAHEEILISDCVVLRCVTV